jgi:hypothetical protein
MTEFSIFDEAGTHEAMEIDTPVQQQQELPAEEDEFEYTKEYVILDTGPRTSTQTLLSASSSGVKLIGMDTPTPFLRIGGLMFKGKHDLNVGSDMIFKDGKHGKELVGVNERRTMFSRVSLHKKEAPEMREE